MTILNLFNLKIIILSYIGKKWKKQLSIIATNDTILNIMKLMTNDVILCSLRGND